MNQGIELEGVKFPEADWEATPESIKQAVRELVRQLLEGQGKMEQLSQRVTELEEKQSKNSKNSSQPPSRDGFRRMGGSVRK